MRFSLRSARRLAAAGLLTGLVLASGHCASKSASGELDPAAAAAIAGEWGVQLKMWDHTEEAVLRFTFDGRALSGSLTVAGREAKDLSNLDLSNGRISFDLDDNRGAMHARGVVDGEVMSGTMKRRAQKGEGGPGFSLGGGGRSGRGHGDGRQEEPGGSRAEEPRSWIAYKRHPAPAGTRESTTANPEQTAAAPSPRRSRTSPAFGIAQPRWAGRSGATAFPGTAGEIRKELHTGRRQHGAVLPDQHPLGTGRLLEQGEPGVGPQQHRSRG
jgi:hypothetical protein